MTHLTDPVTPSAARARPPALPTLAMGVAGGFALGVAARVWMRLIAETPEFTWSGTLFIVLGFTIFGLAQSVAAAARQGHRRRWTLTVARVFGAVGMLPLFVAAGALMLPTVIGGGLACARADWRQATRGICGVVAALPVLFVGNDLLDSFGWSLHSVAGFVAMLAVYGTIIWAAQATFAPRPDGRRLPRWAKVAVPVALGLLLVAGLAQGGIQ